MCFPGIVFGSVLLTKQISTQAEGTGDRQVEKGVRIDRGGGGVSPIFGGTVCLSLAIANWPAGQPVKRSSISQPPRMQGFIEAKYSSRPTRIVLQKATSTRPSTNQHEGTSIALVSVYYSPSLFPNKVTHFPTTPPRHGLNRPLLPRKNLWLDWIQRSGAKHALYRHLLSGPRLYQASPKTSCNGDWPELLKDSLDQRLRVGVLRSIYHPPSRPSNAPLNFQLISPRPPTSSLPSVEVRRVRLLESKKNNDFSRFGDSAR